MDDSKYDKANKQEYIKHIIFCPIIMILAWYFNPSMISNIIEKYVNYDIPILHFNTFNVMIHIPSLHIYFDILRVIIFWLSLSTLTTDYIFILIGKDKSICPHIDSEHPYRIFIQRTLSILFIPIILLVIPYHIGYTLIGRLTFTNLSFAYSWKILDILLDTYIKTDLVVNDINSFFLCMNCFIRYKVTEKLSKEDEIYRSKYCLNHFIFHALLGAECLRLYYNVNYQLTRCPFVNNCFQMLITYLGLSQGCYLLSYVLIRKGCNVFPPFHNPILCTSFKDFWGVRWNDAMSDVFHRTIFIPLKNRGVSLFIVSLLVFLISGLSHEYLFVIGMNDKFGKQILYFIFQAVVCTLQVIFEKTFFKWKRLPWFMQFGLFWLGFGSTVDFFLGGLVNSGIFQEFAPACFGFHFEKVIN